MQRVQWKIRRNDEQGSHPRVQPGSKVNVSFMQPRVNHSWSDGTKAVCKGFVYLFGNKFENFNNAF